MTTIMHPPDTGRANRRSTVMRRIFDEGFATGDARSSTTSAHPTSSTTSSAWRAPEQAIEHVKAAIGDVHRAVPDIAFRIEDSAENGDTIWVRVRGRGTATGPFFGPPSKRPVDFTVIDIARVVDGRLVEHWGVPDRFAMLVQTGVLDRLAPAS